MRWPMRAWIAAIVLLALAPAGTAAQPSATVHRIGFLSLNPLSSPQDRAYFAEFKGGLKDLGYVQGRNIEILYRDAGASFGQLPARARELVGLKPDVIVTYGEETIRAARQATGTIPIVIAIIGDAVDQGFVSSFARPGGNITGLSILAPQTGGKRLEVLKQAVPTITRVAVLWNRGNKGKVAEFEDTERTAKRLGIALQSLPVGGVGDFDSAFHAAATGGANALIAFSEPLMNSQRDRIVGFAAKARLPAMFQSKEYVDVGGLICYGPKLPDQFRRAASFVDRILKGSNPAEMPIEQPTEFELVVNLKTAKALGITIPQSILVRADEVIE